MNVASVNMDAIPVCMYRLIWEITLEHVGMDVYAYLSMLMWVRTHVSECDWLSICINVSL